MPPCFRSPFAVEKMVVAVATKFKAEATVCLPLHVLQVRRWYHTEISTAVQAVENWSKTRKEASVVLLFMHIVIQTGQNTA